MTEKRRRPTAPLPAYDQAVRLLSQRDHATAELRRKLLLREYSRAEIVAAIARLSEQGYLDDRRTARLWAQQESNRTNQGRRKALKRMLEHGLPRELAEAALEEVWDAERELEHARAMLRKLSASLPAEQRASRAGRAALARRLAGRGFDPELIRRLLRGLEGTESEDL